MRKVRCPLCGNGDLAEVSVISAYGFGNLVVDRTAPYGNAAAGVKLERVHAPTICACLTCGGMFISPKDRKTVCDMRDAAQAKTADTSGSCS